MTSVASILAGRTGDGKRDMMDDIRASILAGRTGDGKRDMMDDISGEYPCRKDG